MEKNSNQKFCAGSLNQTVMWQLGIPMQFGKPDGIIPLAQAISIRCIILITYVQFTLSLLMQSDKHKYTDERRESMRLLHKNLQCNVCMYVCMYVFILLSGTLF